MSHTTIICSHVRPVSQDSCHSPPLADKGTGWGWGTQWHSSRGHITQWARSTMSEHSPGRPSTQSPSMRPTGRRGRRPRRAGHSTSGLRKGQAGPWHGLDCKTRQPRGGTRAKSEPVVCRVVEKGSAWHSSKQENKPKIHQGTVASSLLPPPPCTEMKSPPTTTQLCFQCCFVASVPRKLQ